MRQRSRGEGWSRPGERWRLRAALLGVLLVGALPQPAAADGNVTATVDAAGDLWLFGDDLSNALRLEAGGDDTDTFRLRGLDGTTTVNGLPEVTLFAPGTRVILFLGDGHNVAWLGTDYGGEPSCCRRELLVVSGAGDDQIRMIGAFERVTADLGPGRDSLRTGESEGLRGSAAMGTGDDLIEIDGFSGADGFFDLGPGNDQFLVGRSTGLDVVVELGTGDDFLWLEGHTGTCVLRGSDGSDTLEVQAFEHGSLTVETGSGADDVRVVGDPQASGAHPIALLDVDLGAHDDRLAVGNARIGNARFDGGSGQDLYLDLGGNRFALGAPELLSFELPKATPGPDFGRPTRVAGRVADERGRPVPGAYVALVEHGIATLTDDAGAFAFPPVESGHEMLEVVVGARVDGRPRSGAALARPAPLGTTRVEIVLHAQLRNVLVLGSPLYRANAVARNLHALGYRAEEVSRLDALPGELAPYGVIWHVGGTIAAGARPQLAAFVRAGGGLFLGGGSSAVNASVEALVNELVSGGGIDVGATGTATSGLYSFQTGAAGGVARVPNVLTYFYRSAFSRYVTGLAPRNALVVMSTSPDVPLAVWDGQDLVGHRGALLVATDTTWMVAGESLDVFENFQAFLGRQPLARTPR